MKDKKLVYKVSEKAMMADNEFGNPGTAYIEVLIRNANPDFESKVKELKATITRSLGIPLDLVTYYGQERPEETNRTITIDEVIDTNGKIIQLLDVLIHEETGEVALVILGGSPQKEGLAVENKYIGIKDWLSVYPDGYWTVLGNAMTSSCEISLKEGKVK